MTAPTCPAGCGRDLSVGQGSPQSLLCAPCWQSLPAGLRAAVASRWQTYDAARDRAMTAQRDALDAYRCAHDEAVQAAQQQVALAAAREAAR